MAARHQPNFKVCRMFKAKVLYPLEVCPDCAHAEVCRARAHLEEQTRQKRRQERLAEERMRELMKKKLNEAGWERGQGFF